ncbi:MAG: serine/threonine-protein kinase [Rhodoglobus sp.]
MARRLPSPPPILPGFSHIHALGSGGFADVFLYEQNMPRRQVAVKVLLSEVVNDHVRHMFQAEANLMAQLSAHPSILTIYQAGVSSDGRPYLVMELCSPSLSQRYRLERLPVSEVLRIAVRIGSAIETAHRAGVLHRDIKPSNILMTAYGHPVLSDFGIAATLGDSADRDAVGMSIPWSAPEVLMDETAGTVASEVWALAATTYSLLAGRSPFEVPGASNTSSDLISRINRARPQPIDRGDVPASVEKILARGMSRKPEQRQASILELINELQGAESELGLGQTPAEVARDEWALASTSDLEDRTVIRGHASAGSSVSQRRQRRRGDPSTGHAPLGTVVREDLAAVPSDGTPRRDAGQGMRLLGWVVVGASFLVIVLGGIAVVALIRANSTDIPTVSNIQAMVVDDTVEFSWTDPGLTAQDSYRIATDGTEPVVQQREASFVVDADAGDEVCITVTVSREGKLGAPSTTKCADIPG